MQVSDRVPNRDRSDRMRAALLAVGRDLFVAKGFAATGTPEIVAAAGVTRGALYHHFADKAALFQAVVQAEAEAVAEAIGQGSEGLDGVAALKAGTRAFLAAMAVPGRARLMLVEAPAVLAPDVLAAMDAATGGGTLVAGLASGGIRAEPAGQIAALLSAAHDRAALAIAQGDDPAPWIQALDRLVEGLR